MRSKTSDTRVRYHPEHRQSFVLLHTPLRRSFSVLGSAQKTVHFSAQEGGGLCFARDEVAVAVASLESVCRSAHERWRRHPFLREGEGAEGRKGCEGGLRHLWLVSGAIENNSVWREDVGGEHNMPFTCSCDKKIK